MQEPMAVSSWRAWFPGMWRVANLAGWSVASCLRKGCPRLSSTPDHLISLHHIHTQWHAVLSMLEDSCHDGWLISFGCMQLLLCRARLVATEAGTLGGFCCSCQGCFCWAWFLRANIYTCSSVVGGKATASCPYITMCLDSPGIAGGSAGKGVAWVPSG